MAAKKKIITILVSIALVCLLVAAIVFGLNGLTARADYYSIENSDSSLKFERLTEVNPNTETILQNAYLDRYGVPSSKFTYENNGGAEAGAPLSYAFDRNFSSIWRSEKQLKSGDPSTINSVTVTFTKPVLLDRIIYQADSGWSNRGSFTDGLISYIPGDSSQQEMPRDAEYVSFPHLYPELTSATNANLITFKQPITAWQIKIEWHGIHTGHRTCAAASEIIFLQPLSAKVEEVQNLFSDYNQLTLTDPDIGKSDIEELRESVKGYASYDSELSYLLNRAEQVLAGTVKYEINREMGTAENSKNLLTRRGDVAGYARSPLKMAWFGTNRQATGVSIAPGEELIVYVDGEKDDPLPSLVITQHWGSWSSWKSGEYKLSLGKNIIHPQNYLQQGFKDNKGNPLPAGGPVYLVNPYVSPDISAGRSEKVQSDKVKVYFEGGTLIPTFRKGGDEEEYKQLLADYAAAVTADRTNSAYKVVDVTEVVSDNIMLTVRATTANDYYNNKEFSPQTVCENWDKYIKELLRSDGVIIDENDPEKDTIEGRYDPRAQWLNCNIRLMQPYGAAYAFTEHVGIQVDWEGGALAGSGFGWGYTHELGHMMDMGERLVSETTNNMLSKYDETAMSKIATRGDFTKTTETLAPDVRTVPSYWNTNRNNFLIWWLIESYDLDYWSHLENLYRYYNIYQDHLDSKGKSTIGSLNATEKQVLLSSICVGFDLSYYFERWGYNLSANDPVFVAAEASEGFHILMDDAKKAGKIHSDIAPKIWYVDAAQWSVRNKYNEQTSIYSSDDKPVIQNVSKNKTGYNLVFGSAKEKDPRHLGFEIWEGGEENKKVIGFSYDCVFIDTTEYAANYTPRYSVVAFDRGLTYSSPSEWVSEENSAFVCINQNTQKQYSSLMSAFDEAGDNAIILLTANCFASGIVIKDGCTVTLTCKDGFTVSRAGSEPIFTVAAGGNLTISGSSDNKLILDGGGFEQRTSLVISSGTLKLENCILRNNHIRRTVAGCGGALTLSNTSSGVAILNDCEFNDNSSRLGGGVYVRAGSVRLTGCTFGGNHAIEGGALYANGVRITLIQCQFTDNAADLGGLENVNLVPLGGALAVLNGASVTVTDWVKFTGNSAVRGGAVYADGSITYTNGPAENFLLSGNTAEEDGAALYYNRTSGNAHLNISGMTVTQNICQKGGALYLNDNTSGSSTLTVDIKDNGGCRYGIYFLAGTYAVDGGNWQNNIFVGARAVLKAKTSFPKAEGVTVYSDKDYTQDNVFITAEGFTATGAAANGFVAAEGTITYLSEDNALVFTFDPVTVIYNAGGEQIKVQYIKGRNFKIDAPISDGTKYVTAWMLDGVRYEVGEEIAAERDMTFEAVLAPKAVVIFSYPREDVAEETLYITPGERLTLPLKILEKYDLKGWRVNDEYYSPYSSVLITGDLKFVADLTDKLRVDYYISPYTGDSEISAAADEDLLITTKYFSYGQELTYVDLDDCIGEIPDPETYVPSGYVIETYLIEDTRELIDFYSNFTVTSNLRLHAVVQIQPIPIIYMYTTEGGSGFDENFPTQQDFIKQGETYEISIAKIPYGYHITKISLWADFEHVADYSDVKDIENFKIIDASGYQYVITVNVERNDYTVTYKINDSETYKTTPTKYGDIIVLEEPALNKGYHFNSFQIGKQLLTYDETSGTYTMSDVVLDMTTGQELTIVEDTLINMIVSIDPELKISNDRLELDLDADEETSLSASTLDDGVYSVEWQSDNPEVVRVSPNGVLTAISVGNAKITANCYLKSTGQLLSSQVCSVTVKINPGLSLASHSETVYEGEELSLQPVTTNGEGYEFVWYSDDHSVLSVNGGVVTALAAGNAKITVVCFKNGVELASAESSITVLPLLVESITINAQPAKTEYHVGEQFDPAGLVITVCYNSGKTENITGGFDISSPDMTTEGAKTVTVTYKGSSAEFTVNVSANGGANGILIASLTVGGVMLAAAVVVGVILIKRKNMVS